MLKSFARAAARFGKLFAEPFKPRASAEWRRVYGEGAPAFTIE
ncbi:MAG: hypothetical protein ABL957_11005 [Parvularculaceae bacterium]